MMHHLTTIGIKGHMLQVVQNGQYFFQNSIEQPQPQPQPQDDTNKMLKCFI
jgi:hypothetical protein